MAHMSFAMWYFIFLTIWPIHSIPIHITHELNHSFKQYSAGREKGKYNLSCLNSNYTHHFASTARNFAEERSEISHSFVSFVLFLHKCTACLFLAKVRKYGLFTSTVYVNKMSIF